MSTHYRGLYVTGNLSVEPRNGRLLFHEGNGKTIYSYYVLPSPDGIYKAKENSSHSVPVKPIEISKIRNACEVLIKQHEGRGPGYDKPVVEPAREIVRVIDMLAHRVNAQSVDIIVESETDLAEA